MRKPNFFIIGAPKCGTTAMYYYLKSHPNIFMSEVKEPHFFDDHIPRIWYAATTDQYLQLFAKAGEQHTIVGEASTVYLRSKTALAAIREFNPQAKLLIMLRNPVDMLPSYHSQMRIGHREDIENFEEAWRMQDKRRQGENIPALCQAAAFLDYQLVASFGAQVERWYQAFPREQIKVVLMDDFRADTRQVYREVLDFLGIPDDGRQDFPPVNESRTWRNDVLARFMLKPPPVLQYIVRKTKKLLGIRITPGIERLKQLNTVSVKRQPLSPQFKQELADLFAEDIDKLEAWLERDLSHWKQVRA